MQRGRSETPGFPWWQTKSHHSVYHDSGKEKHLSPKFSALQDSISRDMASSGGGSSSFAHSASRFAAAFFWRTPPEERMQSRELQILYLFCICIQCELFAAPSVAAPRNNVGCIVHFCYMRRCISLTPCGAKVSRLITSFLQSAETLSSRSGINYCASVCVLLSLLYFF